MALRTASWGGPWSWSSGGDDCGDWLWEQLSSRRVVRRAWWKSRAAMILQPQIEDLWREMKETAAAKGEDCEAKVDIVRLRRRFWIQRTCTPFLKTILICQTNRDAFLLWIYAGAYNSHFLHLWKRKGWRLKTKTNIFLLFSFE